MFFDRNYYLGQRMSSKRWNASVNIFGSLLIILGSYALVLFNSPNLGTFDGNKYIDGGSKYQGVTSTEQAVIAMGAEQDSSANMLLIPRLSLKVPIVTGGAEALEKGAWHRHPNYGNPEIGGNFTIAAHRFRLRSTPWSTQNSSPFYHLQTLQSGDKIFVRYNRETYTYVARNTYEVTADATHIEAVSSSPKLTLYTCSLTNYKERRLVIEALPQE